MSHKDLIEKSVTAFKRGLFDNANIPEGTSDDKISECYREVLARFAAELDPGVDVEKVWEELRELSRGKETTVDDTRIVIISQDDLAAAIKAAEGEQK